MCTLSEFMAWRAFDRIEPFGSLRDNLHAGIVASACLAPWSENAPPNPDQFVLKPPAPPDSPEDMKCKAMAYTLALGGTVNA